MTTVSITDTTNTVVVLDDNTIVVQVAGLGPQGPGGILGLYGSFIDTTDQPIVSTAVAQPITLNTTLENRGVTIASNSRVTFSLAGTYKVLASIQTTNFGNTTTEVNFFLKKNGSTIADSNTRIDLEPRKSVSVPYHDCFTIEYQLTVADNDYLELWWAANQLNVTLDTIAADGIHPQAPSVILNVAQVMYLQVGATGATGVQGPTGPVGVSGASGIQGPTGAIGISGATGATGPQGATGPIGITGATGVVGASGPIGATGPIGSTGATGPIGITGATGVQGPTGAVGASGATGPIGETGPIGVSGVSGVTGATGVIGISGATGVVGVSGATGATGVVGETGPIGVSGATGVQGPVGASGATGPIGQTGPIGETGPIGVSGATGVVGITGATGVIGISGATGATGVTGVAAPKALTIINPTSSEDVVLFFTTASITFSQIRSTVMGSTPSITFSIRYDTDISASGTEVVTGGITCANTTTGVSTTSFNNATVPIDNFVWLTTSAISGTVTQLAVSLLF